MLYAFHFTGKHDWWARHQKRERMICKTKTSWSLSSRKTNFFIGILKDTNGDTVREKETGKWSDLSSQLLAYGEAFFPTSAPFQRKRQKKSGLWEYAWVLLVEMRIPGQEIFLDGLSFWSVSDLSILHKKDVGVCVQACACTQVYTSASFFSVSFSWYLHPGWCWLFSSNRAKTWLQPED